MMPIVDRVTVVSSASVVRAIAYSKKVTFPVTSGRSVRVTYRRSAETVPSTSSTAPVAIVLMVGSKLVAFSETTGSRSDTYALWV